MDLDVLYSYLKLFFSAIFCSIMVGFLVIRPMVIRSKGIKQYKQLINQYSADCAVVCRKSWGLSKVKTINPNVRLYLIATSKSLILTTQKDSSFTIEIPFNKILGVSFDSMKLMLKIFNNGTEQIVLPFIDAKDSDGAFNRYSLKHANIIDYIAQRVPQEQVNVKL